MLRKLSDYKLNEIIYNSPNVKIFDSSAQEEIESYIIKLSEDTDAEKQDDAFNEEVTRILRKRGH